MEPGGTGCRVVFVVWPRRRGCVVDHPESNDMSLELVLLLKFPREVFQIAPPVPLTRAEGPQVASEFGRVPFYFDHWDTPDSNSAGGPLAMINAFYTHLVARTVPVKLDLALTVPAPRLRIRPLRGPGGGRRAR